MKTKTNILNVKPGDLLSLTGHPAQLGSTLYRWLRDECHSLYGLITIMVLETNDQHIKILMGDKVYYVLKEFGPKDYRAKFSHIGYDGKEVIEWKEKNKTITGSTREWAEYVSGLRVLKLECVQKSHGRYGPRFTIEIILRALATAGKGETSPFSDDSSLEAIINHTVDTYKQNKAYDQNREPTYDDIFEGIRTDMLVEEIDIYKSHHISWKDFVLCFEKLQTPD